MTAPTVLFELQSQIATITINAAHKHNALGPSELAQLHDHFERVGADPSIRCLIITGAGDRTFCAGADLDAMGSGSVDGNQFTDMTQALSELPVATICAFNGSAYGGGSEIGLACDLRVGLPNMRLFVPPARIGLCYPVKGIQRFVATLGVDTTKRLLLFGEEFRGEELLRLRYLTHLPNADQQMSLVHTLAEKAVSHSPTAIRAMKSICNRMSLSIDDLEWAEKLAALCNQAEDLKEGLKARSDKRPAVFRDSR